VLEDVAAAEAEADRGLLGAVADAALVGLGHQRVERRVDALSSFAVHATDEGDIFVARHLLRGLDRKLGDAEPVRHHQLNGRLSLIFSFQTSAPLPLTLPA
jgi:hypothetical protein